MLKDIVARTETNKENVYFFDNKYFCLQSFGRGIEDFTYDQKTRNRRSEHCDAFHERPTDLDLDMQLLTTCMGHCKCYGKNQTLTLQQSLT